MGTINIHLATYTKHFGSVIVYLKLQLKKGIIF